MIYSRLIRPVLFHLDAEFVHSAAILIGEHFPPFPLSYSSSSLVQKINGITFSNPIGLAAGFDYDGHLAATMKNFGFGFSTVGTVTAKPYAGNPKPRLGRLPKSQAIFVNKGFKSEGVAAVAARLDTKNLAGATVGVSLGSRDGSIEEVAAGFDYLKDRDDIKYFELNISCPNIPGTGVFANPKNLEKLLAAIKFSKPTYLKMPNEIEFSLADALCRVALKHSLAGFIFSNLVKKRDNPAIDRGELKKFENLPGNFSGRPTWENSNRLIAHARKKFGKSVTIIGCGGVFTATDAYEKIKLGANLVQLITGLVFEGPTLASSINRDLVRLLAAAGYSCLSEAVGKGLSRG
ncbi:MAG: dihydroorotate dehydrogenase (quinone) [Patescibacteria group bacterium]|nr:dihydroorotate dehydrogenase (quinone) [Patescibacteria group bacterium]MCL5431506.1 dihydroorotate dehydrogenase (quinone) [Patescibacteria group bacterium]